MVVNDGAAFDPFDWEQVQSLFYQALELPHDRRSNFLEAACRSNSALHTEVASLLASADASSLISPDDNVEPLQAAVRRAAEDALDVRQPGAILGPYTIFSLLGTGGMGEVYLAEDSRLNRKVALKLLKAGPVHNGRALERFAREAQAASALNHPNILTVYEFGEAGTYPYMVTEFVEGATLRQKCAEGPLPHHVAVDVAIQMGRALAAAHAAGIIHRDIKPENVIVRPDGLVKVLDFGIAKLTQGTSGSGRVPLQTGTVPGTVLGTIKYMSPEQARAVPLDLRSDLFSLGSVLYEMVAGRAPFSGATDSDLIAEILKGEPPALGMIAPQCEPVLEHIVSRALRKDPSERYPSAEAMVADLCAFQSELHFKVKLRDAGALPAVEIGGTKPPGRSVKRAWVAWAALLLGLLSLGAAFLANGRTGWFHPQPSIAPMRTIAVVPFRNLTNDPQSDFLGFSLADAITSKLGYVSTLVVRPSSSIEKYRDRAVDPHEVASELKVNTLLTGSYLRAGDSLRINTQLIDVRADRLLWQHTADLNYSKLLSVQDKVTQEIIDGLQLKLTSLEAKHLHSDEPSNALAYETYLRGVDLYALGDYGGAIRMLERSASMEPAYGLTWAHLGRAYTTDATLRFGGREQYAKAKAAYQRALSLDSSLIALRVYEANLLTDTGDVEQAVPLLRDALATSPNNAEAHWELGYAYRFAGILAESIVECQKARTLDPEVKINSSAMNSYLYIGDYDTFLASLPSSQGVYVLFYRGFGEYYKNDFLEAARNFDQAYAIAPDQLPSQIGKALSDQINGRSAEGLKLLRDTEGRIEERGVTDAESVYKVAQAYAALGDRVSSLRLLRRSIDGGFFPYPYLVSDPLTRNMRDTPEFGALMTVAQKRYLRFKSEVMPTR